MTATAPSLAPVLEIPETATLDLKREFDPASNGEWCELIKDIAAMANSGGGRIIIGVDDDGTPSGFAPDKVLATDPADFGNKVFSYTGVHFAGVSCQASSHASAPVAELVIGEAPFPLIFSKVGNYVAADNRQRAAFQPGTLYVRHGAKSEPANSDDLRDIIERHVKRDRVSLMANLRQVVEAPAGSVVTVAAAVAPASDFSREIRLVQDPAATPTAVLDINRTHPHRQKEIVAQVNDHFQGKVRVTSGDILAIRCLHKTDTDISLCYRPKFGSPQYTDLFVNRLISQIENDAAFLPKLRQDYHEITIARNRQRAEQKYSPLGLKLT
jgi:hypothetical protein